MEIVTSVVIVVGLNNYRSLMESFLEYDLLFDKENKCLIEYHKDGSAFMGSVGLETNVASPIRLSVEILMVCGFTQDVNHNYHHVDGLCVNTSLDKPPFECEGTSISYLHELQQLFRNKFGKELLSSYNKLFQTLQS